jgi:hypothetical protein
VDCEHRGERAIEGDVLMQIGIISDLGTTPRNPVGVRVDGSSARRAGMRSRNGLGGDQYGDLPEADFWPASLRARPQA